MKKLLLLLCILLHLPQLAFARDCNVAAGDAQRVINVSTTNASGIITAASNPWVVGDVGRQIWVTFAGSSIIGPTTIASFQSAGQVTTTAPSSMTTTTGIATWGSIDATSAITTAVTNCTGNANTNYIGGSGGLTIRVPTAGNVRLVGWYMVTGCIYNVQASGPVPSIIGSGRVSTGIFTAPSMTPCTNAQLIDSRGYGQTFQDFTIDGGDSVHNYSAALFQVFQSSYVTIRNVTIAWWGSTQPLSRALSVITSSHIALEHVTVQGSQQTSRDTACEIGGNGNADDLVCSNHYRNLLVNIASSRGTAGSAFLFRGGIIDECYDPQLLCTIVNDNMELNARGTSFFSTVAVGAGSVFYATDVNTGMYNANAAVPALTIGVGGKVFATRSTWRGAGATKAVTNNGKFVDVGGNEYKACTLASNNCVNKTAAQAFVGNLPVVR